MSVKGNTIGSTSPRADWAEQDPSKASYIRNKPDSMLDFFSEEDIEEFINKAANAQRLEYMLAPNSVVTFKYSTTRSVSIISCRASLRNGHAVIVYNGYGFGGAARSSATILMGGGGILCAVTPEGEGNGVTIWNETSVSCTVSVLELIGNLPTAAEGDGGTTKPDNANNTLVDKTYVDQAFAPTGYGLGGLTGGACADVNTAIRNGWYNIYGETANPPTVNGVTHNVATMLVVARSSRIWQTVYSYTSTVHAILQRTSWDSGATWKEWEWTNPTLTVGVEYRTTERYQGAAVYKKVDINGNILWRKDGETQWRLLSAANYVATATVE